MTKLNKNIFIAGGSGAIGRAYTEAVLGRGDDPAKDEEQITRNVIDAARKAKVKKIIYTSVYLADQRTNVAHFEIKGELEKVIQKSGKPTRFYAPVRLWIL